MNFKNYLNGLGKARLLLLALLAASFALSLFAYFAAAPGVRRSFFFQSVDSGKCAVEWRFMASKKGSQRHSAYVEELLLGPKTERSRPLFSPGTKAEFCFSRGKVLYVGLSAAALEKTGNASEVMDGLALFKRNVLKAFPGIKRVELYIDKKPLFLDE